MKAFEQSTGGSYEKAPEGQHIARLVGIIDEGTQTWEFQGTPKSGQKLYLQFELYPEDDDGQPMTNQNGEFFLVGEEYTAVLNDKSNLTKLITSWRGKALEPQDYPFDFSRMLGKYALISVAHNKSADGAKTYANIAGIAPVPRKLAQNAAGESILPQSSTKPFFFDLDADDWKSMLEIYTSRLWQRIQQKITMAPEYAQRNGHAPLPALPKSNAPSVASGSSSGVPAGGKTTAQRNEEYVDEIPF